MKLLVASNNAKKLGELQRILDQAGIANVELLALADVPNPWRTAAPSPRTP